MGFSAGEMQNLLAQLAQSTARSQYTAQSAGAAKQGAQATMGNEYQEEMDKAAEAQKKGELYGGLGKAVGGLLGGLVPGVGPLLGPALGSALGGTAGSMFAGGDFLDSVASYGGEALMNMAPDLVANLRNPNVNMLGNPATPNQAVTNAVPGAGGQPQQPGANFAKVAAPQAGTTNNSVLTTSYNPNMQYEQAMALAQPQVTPMTEDELRLQQFMAMLGQY